MRRRTLKPDDERESWGFLSLDFSENKNDKVPKVEGWYICYGNREKTTRTKSSRSGNEEDILKELGKEIKYSRDSEVLLVAFRQSTLKKLRTRFLYCDEELGAGMKEADFLTLTDLLSDNFEGFESSSPDDICDRLGISVKQSKVNDTTDPLHPEEENKDNAVRSLRLRRLFLKVGKLVDSNTYN